MRPLTRTLLSLACLSTCLSLPAVGHAEGDRKAFLVAVQEFDPGTRAYFQELKYTTKDVVAMYVTLTDPARGRFKPQNVRVVASRNQLEKLREKLSCPTAADENARLCRAIDQIENDSRNPEVTTGHAEKPRGAVGAAVTRTSLAGEHPTLAEITDALSLFVDGRDHRGGLEEGDEAFVYFSSHGFSTLPKRGLLSGVGDVALVAADTQINKSLVPTDELRMQKVLSVLEGSLSQRIVVLQAACANNLEPRKKPSNAVASKGAVPRMPDFESSSITVIGASREFALEGGQGIEGDLFTEYFRQVLEQNWKRLGPGWSLTAVDLDGDGAISVQEAYNVAELFVRTATNDLTARNAGYPKQEPYMVSAGNGEVPFILSGTPVRPPGSWLKPPINVKFSSGGRTKSVRLRMDGARVDGPRHVEPGRHRFQLVVADPDPLKLGGAGEAPDGSAPDSQKAEPLPTMALPWEVGGNGAGKEALASGSERVIDTVDIYVKPRQTLDWESIFAPRWRLEVQGGYGRILGGDPAFNVTAGRNGDPLWSGATVGLELSRIFLSSPDQAWSLEAGGRLTLGSSTPSVSGNYYTTNYLVEVSPFAQWRQKLYGRFDAELTVGVHLSEFYTSMYDFRKSMLVTGIGPQVALQFKVSPRQLFSVGWSLGFMYADLDCYPPAEQITASSGDPSLPPQPAEVASEQAYRCDGTPGHYVEAPSIYALSDLGIGWEWRF